jgi:MFS-type transporter involved in bile tolerance (Atg22 family)
VRGTAVVQWLIILVVAAALGYVVVRSAKNWADWIVFGVIVCAALGGAIAVWNRQYPQMSKKRTFTRDSDSNW